MAVWLVGGCKVMVCIPVSFWSGQDKTRLEDTSRIAEFFNTAGGCFF